MKRVLLFLGLFAALLSANKAAAQDRMLFNHLSIGAEVGTTGYGLELAMPCTPYLTFRTGLTTMPRLSHTENIDYTINNKDYEAKVKATLHMTDWKLLADIYPFRGSSFHLTTGFYKGDPNLVQASNSEALAGLSPGDGVEIGGKAIFPDEQGKVYLQSKTKGFKPYLGLGFGRAVSRKHKVNCAFDLGVQFWGKPALQAYSADTNSWTNYRKDDVNDEDLNDAIKVMEKIVAYPVMSFRIYFNAF